MRVMDNHDLGVKHIALDLIERFGDVAVLIAEAGRDFRQSPYLSGRRRAQTHIFARISSRIAATAALLLWPCASAASATRRASSPSSAICSKSSSTHIKRACSY